MKSVALIVIFTVFSLTAEGKGKQFTIGVNPLETAAFMLVNEIFWEGLKGLTYIPIHVNGQWRIRPHFALDFGFVYRYENYHKEKKIITWNAGKPVYDSEFGGEINGKPIWVNYHEFFFLVGPRYNINPNDLFGFYVTLPLGMGIATSPNYFAWTIDVQPELGYSWRIGESGVFFSTGVGVLFNLPLYENPDITPVVGAPFGMRYLNPAHHAIPILNFTVGGFFNSDQL